MITILNEMEYVVAILANDESAALPYTDDRIHEKLNDAYLTLTFRTHGRQEDGSPHPDAAQLVGGNKVVYPDKNGELQLFIIKTVEEVEELDGTMAKEIYAEHTALELNGVVIRPQTFTGVTAQQFLQHVISGTRWKIGVVEWLGLQTINFDDYTAGIQAIITGAAAFGGEFRFRAVMSGGKLSGLYIDLVERRGIETGIQIEVEHNMKSVKRIEDGSQIYTALIGLARGQSGDDGYKTFSSISAPDKPSGQDWIGASDALQKYGILLENGERQHYFGTYLYEGNENVTAARLLELTRAKLREVSVPKYTYETTFMDLSQISGYEATKFGIGDTLNIINVDFSPPLLVSARVIEAEYGSNPEDSNVVLGDYRNIWEESQVAALRALRGTVMKSASEWEGGIAREEAESFARAAAARGSVNEATIRAASYEQQTSRVIASERLADTTIRDRVTAAKTEFESSRAAYASAVDAAAADGAVDPDEQATISAAWNVLSDAENELSSALQAAEADILRNTEEAAAEEAGAIAENTVTQYAEKKIFRGPDIPENPDVNDLWVDMTEPTRPIWKQFDGTNWINVTRTNINEMLGQLESAQLANNAVTAQKIVDGAISGVKIATGAVTGLKIADNAVEANKIVDGAISEIKIAANAVTSLKIADNAVAASKIVNGAVDSLKLADAAVTGLKIADNAVAATKIVDGAIAAAKIATGAVIATKIATGAVETDKIAANAVTNTKIVDGAINDVKIATNAVTGLKIADNAVAAAKIVDGAIAAAKIATGAVIATKIATGAVETDKIAANAVTNAKIIDGAINDVKIATGAVTGLKIADNAVAAAKIVDGAISELKIAANAVSEAKIAASAITEGKIATGAVVADKIAANAVTAAKIAADTITAAQIAANAITATEIAANAVTAVKINAGAVETDKIAANAIIATKIAAGAIESDKIAANAVVAGKIAAGSISTSHIVSTGIDAGVITAGQIAAARLQIGDGTTFAAGYDPTTKETPEGAQEKVDAVEIGGRNLLADSHFYGGTNNGWYTPYGPLKIENHVLIKTLDATATAASRQQNVFTLEKGLYTLTLYARSTKGFQFRGFLNANILSANDAGASEVFQKHSVTFEVPADGPVTVRMYMNSPAEGDVFEIDWYKLEKGNKSTDWTPAPEDTSAEITGAVTPANDRLLLWQYEDTSFFDGGQIYTDSITANQIAAGAITADEIAANAITAAKIAAGTITANEIATDAITAAKIAAGAIESDKIAANAITAGKIAAGSISTSHIVSTGIDAGVIKAGSIGAQYIQIGSGTQFAAGYDPSTKATTAEAEAAGTAAGTAAAKPANDRILLWQYQDTSFFDGGQIYTDSITANQIAAGAITAAEIAANTITAAKIAAGTITANEIAGDTITAAKIAAGAITASEIATNAVVTDKIAANAITAAKIAVGTITANEIATDTITSAKIAAGAITASEIATDAVTAVKIAANTITAAKIAAGTITANEIASDTITAAKIAAGAITADEIAANAVIADKIAANAITAVKISAGAIETDKLGANSIVAGKIAAGAITTSHISTAGIDAGVLTAGSVIASDIVFTGTLNGATGTFSGAVKVGDPATTYAEMANGIITAARTDASYNVQDVRMTGGGLYFAWTPAGGTKKQTSMVQIDSDLVITPPSGGQVYMSSNELTAWKLTANGLINGGSLNVSGSSTLAALTASGTVTANSTLVANGILDANSDLTLTGRLSGSSSSADVEVSGTYTALSESGICGIGGMQNATAYTGAMAGVYVQFRHRKTYTPASIAISGRSSNLDSSTNIATADITNYGFWLYLNHTSGKNTFKYWRGSYTA